MLNCVLLNTIIRHKITKNKTWKETEPQEEGPGDTEERGWPWAPAVGSPGADVTNNGAAGRPDLTDSLKMSSEVQKHEVQHTRHLIRKSRPEVCDYRH